MGEIMTSKEIIRYAKSELEQYDTLRLKANQNNLLVIGLLAKINGVSSGSPSIIPTGEKQFDPHWRSPLFEEIEELEKEIDSDCHRVKKVDRFLESLQPKDREIITELHIKKGKDRAVYGDYCFEVKRSRIDLFRYVEQLILRKWER